jgi:hypothetical protein
MRKCIRPRRRPHLMWQLSKAPRNRLVRQPILRQLYLILFLVFTLLILLPSWTLYYLPRSRRPRQSWSLQRCLRVRWSRHLCGLIARCEIDYLGRDLSVEMVSMRVSIYTHLQDPLKLSHSHPVTIPPAPPSFLVGHPAQALNAIHSSKWTPHLIPPRLTWGRWERDPCSSYNFAPVQGFWFVGQKALPTDKMPLRPSDAPVMLHFHGGGYLCGTAAETDLTSSIPKALVKHSAIHHILSVDYRLAPRGPWPVPLLDAISAYKYLVDEGVEDIVIAGDSAGGHLALALTRWLQDEKALPMPKALVLMSPWCDVGFSNSWGEAEYTFNSDCDTVSPPRYQRLIKD